MNDKFLYQNRPPVRRGFGESLYARISNEKPAQKGWQKMKLWVLRMGLAGALALGAILTISQPARAAVLAWIKEVAGFQVEEVGTLPVSSDEGIVMAQDARDSLVHILKVLPFEFALPAYVPDGFIFDDNVDVQPESLFMQWHGDNANEILMQVDTEHGQRYLTGVNAAQELMIGAQSALLVQGGYDANGVWDAERKMLNVIQRKDGLIYWLIYIGNPEADFDADAVQAELVHMMSSIPALENFDEGTYSYDPVSVAETIKNAPFKFGTPAYLPAGVEPHEGISAYSKDWVLLVYQSASGQEINLLVQNDWRITIPAGIEAAEETSVNSHPTLIIHGGFDEQGVWDNSLSATQLYWRVGGLIYSLSSRTVPETELLKVARSIR